MAADPVVLDLTAARAAREAEARLRASERPLIVTVIAHCTGVIPPGGDWGASPEMEILDASDLLSDPGRLGEIARALVARAEAAKGGAAHAG